LNVHQFHDVAVRESLHLGFKCHFLARRLAEYGLTSREMVSFVQRYISGRSGGQIVFQGEEVAFETKVEGFTDRDIVELMNVQYTARDNRKLRLSDVPTGWGSGCGTRSWRP
jgi:multidrug efflux pump subunit AcrB